MAITKEVNIVVKEFGLDTVQKQVNKLDSSLENLSDTQEGLAKSMQSSSNSVLDNGGAMGLLNDATGGLAMTVKDAVEASVLFTKSQRAAAIGQAFYTTVVGTSTGAMKLFRIALVSTGIGAIIVGLGLLIANFDKVKKVVLNLVPGLAVVGAIFTKLVEKITDFVGVTSDASRELDRLGQQAEETLAKNKFALEAYGDTYDQYTKRKIEANSKYAQQVKDINEDETLSEKQKLERLKILRETANREIVKAETDRNSELAKKRKDAQDKLNEEQKQASDKAKQDQIKAAEEAEKVRLENLKKDAQRLFDTNEQAKQDVADLNEFKNAQLEEQAKKEEEAGANRIARIQGEYDEELRIEQEVANAKKDIQNQVVENISATIGLIAQLAGKSKAIQAATVIADAGLGIFKIIANTNAANAAASLKYALLPGGQALAAAEIIQNKISAGIGIASTGLAAGRALAALGKGGSVQGGSAGDGGRPSAPSFNLVQGTSSNQIASSINTQQPIQAYVVSKNVSTGLELDRNIIKSASL